MRRVFVDLGDSGSAADALALARELSARIGAELSLNGRQPGESDLIVGERLPAEAPAAVALAPRGLAETDPLLERVLVGHDGSRESARALGLGTDLARRLGVGLVIVGVVEPSLELARSSEALAEEARIARHLERALEAAPVDVAAESRLLAGEAAATLAAAAVTGDLLVLGSRSQFASRPRMRPGSVGRAVAERATSPTLIATA